MLFCVGRGVIKRKERIKVFQRFLRYIAAHFLRLVKNDYRAVRLDNIEFIALGIDYTRFLALAVLFKGGRKRLRVDYHYVDTAVGGKRVKLC